VRSPILQIDLVAQQIDVFTVAGARFPYLMRLDPVRRDLLVAAYDVTLRVDVAYRNAKEIGPGRLLAFEVASNGHWAVGIDVFEAVIWIYDLGRETVDSVPLAFIDRPDELSRVPVCFDPVGHYAAIADLRASELILLRPSME
jgi:hypothetical protein